MFLSELWFSQGICLVVELLGHMVALFLVFLSPSFAFAPLGDTYHVVANAGTLMAAAMHNAITFFIFISKKF